MKIFDNKGNFIKALKIEGLKDVFIDDLGDIFILHAIANVYNISKYDQKLKCIYEKKLSLNEKIFLYSFFKNQKNMKILYICSNLSESINDLKYEIYEISKDNGEILNKKELDYFNSRPNVPIPAISGTSSIDNFGNFYLAPATLKDNQAATIDIFHSNYKYLESITVLDRISKNESGVYAPFIYIKNDYLYYKIKEIIKCYKIEA